MSPHARPSCSIANQKPVMVVIAFALCFVANVPARAQTFNVLHSFTGGVDGTEPTAGVILDKAGNIYGTTSGGGLDGFCGPHDCGQVFKVAKHGSGWVLQSLHTFYGSPSDGSDPGTKLVMAPDGTLLGTTYFGGTGQLCSFDYGTGCGIAFSLRPQPASCKSASCPWVETVLYSFQGGHDGQHPTSAPVMDAAGNLYGVNINGGDGNPYGCLGFDGGCGVVYQLAPSQGGWTENVIYAFTDDGDGGNPAGDMVLDKFGNLYGTGQVGSGAPGSVFQVSRTGSGWTERVIQWLQANSTGIYSSGLIADSAGNLYGGTAGEGPGGGGTVYELVPGNGGWNIELLLVINGTYGGGPTELVMDAAGNLYGATVADGAYGKGSVFKLTPSGGGWTYTDLYDFTGGSDGQAPYGPLAIDGAGNIYGVVSHGSSGGYGAVFEITP
jgi:uncharacterized repeat protein (TIGR03803 family)